MKQASLQTSKKSSRKARGNHRGWRKPVQHATPPGQLNVSRTPAMSLEQLAAAGVRITVAPTCYGLDQSQPPPVIRAKSGMPGSRRCGQVHANIQKQERRRRFFKQRRSSTRATGTGSRSAEASRRVVAGQKGEVTTS